jgi:hypothetical protein
MAVMIRLRRGTQSQWSSENPVLISGEIVIETDTNQVKIGNDTSNYNSLSYAFDPGEAATSFNPFF